MSLWARIINPRYPLWDKSERSGFSIYCKTHNQAKATEVVIAKFLKTKLQLTINKEKSGIRRPVNFTLLGFGFVSTYQKGSKNQYQLVVAEKAWKKLK